MSTLICTIELDKKEEQGITIHVKSKNGDDEHKVQLNKDQITLTSRNGSDTTVTTQTANSIKLEVAGGKSVFHMDQDNIDISCKDFTLNASGAISLKASGDMKLDGQAIEANSSGNTKIDAGQNFTATGKVQATMSGNIATVEGKSIANVKGSLVKLG